MTMKKSNVRPVDRNFAPKGCYAVADKSKEGCVGCRYEPSTPCGLNRKCTPGERPDKRNVIFVTDKPPVQVAGLASDYEFCPHCRGRFSFRKPDKDSKCPWCGYHLQNVPVGFGSVVLQKTCKCGRALEGYETTCCKFCMNALP